MFSRHGGCSKKPYTSLNLSFAVGDDPQAVAYNRARIKEALGLKVLVSAKQVHGRHVAVIPFANHDMTREACDVLMTDQPGVGLLIQQADCQAVLLHDPVNRAVAAIHNGWRGSVQNVIGLTILAMRNQFGTEPSSLRAVISPSLGPCCAEFRDHRKLLPPDFLPMQVRENYFDFWEISRQQLMGAGVLEKQIDIQKICTRCSKDFFSHRRTSRLGQPNTGRQGSIIALPEIRHPGAGAG